MDFFTSGFFWFLEGIILCVAIIGFNIWTKDHAIPMPLWKWTALVIWIVLFGFTIAFIFTSIGEKEIKAAIKGGILFGLITAIYGAGLWQLIKKIGTKAPAKAKNERENVEKK